MLPPDPPRTRNKQGRPRVKTAKETSIDILLSPRYKAFLAGEIRVEDLSLKELQDGAINDAGFEYARRPPEWIPREFALAVTRELRLRMQKKFEAAGIEAIDTILNVMREGEGEQYDQFSRAGTGRLKAAQEVVNRVMGKVPDKIEARIELTPWEQMQGGAELIVDVDFTDLPEER